MKRLLKSRYSLLIVFLLSYMFLSFLVRTYFFSISLNDLSFSFEQTILPFLLGFLFDFSVVLAFVFPYNLYLLALPSKFVGSFIDRFITIFYFFVLLILVFFSLMAEFPFWEEFGVRFNFIAVDYLIYTYEVLANINESYPLPLLLSLIALLITGAFYLLYKFKFFEFTFRSKDNFINKIYLSSTFILLTLISMIFLTNSVAEFSLNKKVNEISKNGVFSFFAAYRSNTLDYDAFYKTIDNRKAYDILRENLLQDNQVYKSPEFENIFRETKGKNEIEPNIIMVVLESFSGDFISEFGNNQNITPNFDDLVEKSVFFSNVFATGTRTVRGMEALTLSVPPTPGHSIVRRPNNENLFSISSILKNKSYHPYFIYGGDGYFDNMNSFFGNQGFDIVDRDRGNPLSETIKTHRYSIQDNEVSFENAWGISDEDLYNQAIKYADISQRNNEHFFEFIMTTSNHRPYTFPDGKIDLKSGTRNAAVKYTDFALGNFLKEAENKSWFKNTVFIIIADHCASSAGRWEINLNNHHIPALIYNLNEEPTKINKLASQIDIFPTLLGYLNWNYETELYGKDINLMKPNEERAFIANYRTLGLLKKNIFTQLNDKKMSSQFIVRKNLDKSPLENVQQKLIDETISYYQTASERFKNGKMKNSNP